MCKQGALCCSRALCPVSAAADQCKLMYKAALHSFRCKHYQHPRDPPDCQTVDIPSNCCAADAVLLPAQLQWTD
jgi:hypothetical protein